MAEYVGKLVRKRFVEGWFKGKVTEWVPESRFWHVEYEDGDSEDIYKQELLRILEEEPNSKSKGQSQAPAGTRGRKRGSTSTGRDALSQPASAGIGELRGTRASRAQAKDAKSPKTTETELAACTTIMGKRDPRKRVLNSSGPKSGRGRPSKTQPEQMPKAQPDQLPKRNRGRPPKKLKPLRSPAAEPPDDHSDEAEEDEPDAGMEAEAEDAEDEDTAGAAAEDVLQAEDGAVQQNGDLEDQPDTAGLAETWKALSRILSPEADETDQGPPAGQGVLAPQMGTVAVMETEQADEIIFDSDQAAYEADVGIMRAAPTSGSYAGAIRYHQRVIHNGIVYIAGQVATEPSLATLEEQINQVLTLLEEQLMAAGSSKEHLLKVNVLLKDINAGAETFNALWEQWIDPHHTPARTTYQAALIRPELLVEIDAVAAVVTSD